MLRTALFEVSLEATQGYVSPLQAQLGCYYGIGGFCEPICI